MDQKVLNLLTKERTSVLAISLSDGTPHAACMAFAYKASPLEIFFLTDKTTRKCEPLLKGFKAHASFVIGLDEKALVSLQVDGDIKIEGDQLKIEEIKKIYFEKYPEHKRYENKESVYLVFTPTWWRYTDFKPIPNLIISSD